MPKIACVVPLEGTVRAGICRHWGNCSSISRPAISGVRWTWPSCIATPPGSSTPAVVALTNDWLAYALEPEQYRKGNYEAMMSFYGDQLGPTLLQSVQSGLKPK